MERHRGFRSVPHRRHRSTSAVGSLTNSDLGATILQPLISDNGWEERSYAGQRRGGAYAGISPCERPTAHPRKYEIHRSNGRERLLNNWNTYVAHYSYNGRVWVRGSAQIWNEVSDFEYGGRVSCKEIVDAHGGA